MDNTQFSLPIVTALGAPSCRRRESSTTIASQLPCKAVPKRGLPGELRFRHYLLQSLHSVAARWVTDKKQHTSLTRWPDSHASRGGRHQWPAGPCRPDEGE